MMSAVILMTVVHVIHQLFYHDVGVFQSSQNQRERRCYVGFVVQRAVHVCLIDRHGAETGGGESVGNCNLVPN